ncbi:hypothetical protein [Paraburkholderia strydomiana]
MSAAQPSRFDTTSEARHLPSRGQPHFRDSIVVLEDVTELACRIDRSIMTLRHAGILDRARAIVLGEFVRCPLPAGVDYSLADVLLDVLAPLGVPIYGGLPLDMASAICRG